MRSVRRRACFGLLSLALGLAMLVPAGASWAADDAPRWNVVGIDAEGQALRGTPTDIVAVRRSYVGLVVSAGSPWFVTSRNGLEWRSHRPGGLPQFISLGATMFVDRGRLYLDARELFSDGRPGERRLYVSDASASTWRPVPLPTPPGAIAIARTAASIDDRWFIGGPVAASADDLESFDGAIWTSDDDGVSWRLVDPTVFSGVGGQAVFGLERVGRALVAGGGDTSLVPPLGCCYRPYGAAFWRSDDAGAQWTRAEVRGASYEPPDDAVVLGFVRGRGVALLGDVSGRPGWSAQSVDGGRSWELEVRGTRGEGGPGVVFPRASEVLERRGRFIATTRPKDECGDCTQGSLAVSSSGETWRDVTPRFPCGTNGRTNYGFASKPVVIGSTVVALAGCGEELGDQFDEALLATSDDNGASWTVQRHGAPTGGPIRTVARRGTIVTLAADRRGGPPGRTGFDRINAITIHE